MKKKIKALRLKDFSRVSYACRGCLTLTNRMYKVKNVNIIACCPDCARDAIEFIKDKQSCAISPKILKKV